MENTDSTKVRYSVDGSYYDIPSEKVEDFEREKPQARQVYRVGQDSYAIPLDKRDGFTAQYPNAEYWNGGYVNPDYTPEPEQPQTDPVLQNVTNPAPQQQMQATEQPQKPGFWARLGKNLSQAESSPQGVSTPDIAQQQSEKKPELPEDWEDRSAEFDTDYDVFTKKIDAKLAEKSEALAERSREREKKMGRWLSSIYNAGQAENGGVFPQAQEEIAAGGDPEADQLRAAAQLFENAKKTKDAAYEKKGVVAGLAETVTPSTWDFGVTDMKTAQQVYNLAQKLESNEDLTENDELLLEAMLQNAFSNEYYSDYLRRGYKAGKVTGESLPFMLEFLMNPLAGGEKAASGGAIKVLEKRLAKEMAKRAEKAAAKTAEKTAFKAAVDKGAELAMKGFARGTDDLLSAAGMAATTGSVRTMEDALSRMTGQIQFKENADGGLEFNGFDGGENNWWKAAAKAYGATTIEDFSEMFGNYFRPIGQAAKKGLYFANKQIGLEKVNNFIEGIGAAEWARAATDFLKRTEWNGPISEFSEEIVGGVMNALTVGDQTMGEVFDKDNLIDTFLGVALFGGVVSAMKTAGYRTESQRNEIQRKNIAKEGQSLFGEDWDRIQKQLDAADEQSLKAITLLAYDPSADYTKEQQEAIAAYAAVRANQIGREKGLQKKEEYINEGVEEGKAASGPEEINQLQIQDEYSRTRAERESENGGEPTASTELGVEHANAVMQGRRDAVRDQITEAAGQQFWSSRPVVSEQEGQANTEMEDVVDVITYADGSEAYVISSDNGTLAIVDSNGKKGFITEAELAELDANRQAVRDAVRLDAYLDTKIAAQNSQAEQQRMAQDAANNLAAVQQRVQEEGAVNVGTPESEQLGTVVDMNPAMQGGVAVQVEGEQQPRMMTWDQVATSFGMPLAPKSNQEIVDERINAEDDVERYNKTIAPGSTLTVPMDEESVDYQFKYAENIEGDVIIKATDPVSGQEVDLTPEMVSNMDALLKGNEPTMPVADVQGNPVPEVAEEVTPVNIFDDPAANALGISSDYAYETKRGNVVVDGSKLWAEKPSLWAEWNDRNPNRVIPTRDFLADKLNGIDQEVEKARADLEAEAKGSQNPDRMDELQEIVDNKVKRQTEVRGLVSKYEAAEKKAADAANGNEPLTYELSDEVDENGRQFVLNSKGSLEFGRIPAESGLTSAPILLSEGEITNPATNDGYGLVHIEARHGDQIRKAGFKSVIDFIENVAQNYDVIRRGRDREGNQTYMLQLTDKHNNTLMVELSGDGTYWNINTAGIFKTSYGANRDVVYNRHTTAKPSAETVEVSQVGEQGGTAPTSSMNTPTLSSENKDSNYSVTGADNIAQSAEEVIANAQNALNEAKSEDERAAILQQMLDQLGARNTAVVTRGTVIGQMRENGSSEAMIKQVADALQETAERNERVEGFYDPSSGMIYMLADQIDTAEDVNRIQLHEEKHMENAQTGAHYDALRTGVSREEMRDAMRMRKRTNVYNNYSSGVLADEVMAVAAEIAEEESVQAIPQRLRELGVRNEDFINFVQNNIDYGRRNGQRRHLERGNSLQSESAAVSGGQDGRNQQPEPGNVGEQGNGPAEGGEQGTRGGEEQPAGEPAGESGTVAEPSAEEDLHSKGLAANEEETRFSVRYVPDEANVDKIAEDISSLLGISKAKAKRWVKSETSLAPIILDENNSPYLNYEGDDRYTAIKKDSDYPQGTVDFNNICRKRIAFTNVYQRIQKAYPNVIITGEDLAKIRQIMKDNGYEVACGLCYVEDRRQLLGEIANFFIEELNSNFDGYIHGRTTSEPAKERIDPNKEKKAQNYRNILGNDVKEDLNIYDLITLDGSEALAQEHPGIYAAFLRFNADRGQAAGNLFQGYAEYKREIQYWNDKKVAKVNANGGLRIFSYSDFEAHHLIDLVQIILDCAKRGVMIQGYTKVPAFARAIANTNIKMNRSLIPLGDTGMVDGQLAFDPVEGIDFNSPDFLESNDNVGNILIGINDEQIRLAMADPRIHYIIPYHSNQSGILRQLKQTGAWTNYKYEQTETGQNVPKHGVNIYTDVLAAAEAEGKPIRNERQFVEKYLEVCKNNLWAPKFARFLNTDASGDFVYTPGYYKMLVDFKMFDENGRILPQKPVVAEFDDAFNQKILEDYVRDAQTNNNVVSDEVYNEIVNALGLQDRVPQLTDAQRFAYEFVNGTPAEETAREEASIRPSIVGMDTLEQDGVVVDNEAMLNEYGLSHLTLTKNGDVVTVNRVEAAEQGKGAGTRFMNELTAEADKNGWTLALTPDDTFGATSVNRLKKFYKRFGFKENKGRNTDFTVNESMVRRPHGGVHFSVSAEDDAAYMKAVADGDMNTAQEMVDRAAERAGYTIHGYHGTTHNFVIFDREKGNAEGNWGKGFYFTTSKDDATANYGNEEGPDLQSKIYLLAESMEWMDGYEDMDYEERREAAKRILTGDNPHVISAAIRMENPVVFDARGGQEETFFDFDSGYNPETDEYEGEESGLLLDFINAWNEELNEWEWEGNNVPPNEILEYGYDGLTASQLEAKAREILDSANLENSEGQLASGEFLRAVFERMGFDGIIDNNVNTKFGTQRRFGVSMDGVDYGVSHIVAFQPNQIKQADAVTYDNNGNVIPLSERFNPEKEDIRFSMSADTKALFDKAKEFFGTTRDIREAGYVLPDGSLLDFSGRHMLDEGSDDSFLRGSRTTDHREVEALAYEKDGNTPTGIDTDMPDFIRRGAVRIDDNAGSINLANKPTREQQYAIERIVRDKDGNVWVDFGDGWDTTYSVSYDGAKPARVINDIKRYFDEGVEPQGISFSLRGVLGAENDETAMQNLGVAQEMEAAGKDAKTIWQATGWEKGKDGKWREEIPDGTAKAVPASKKSVTVGDIIDAPELFASYPEIKDYKVNIKKTASAGAFIPSKKEIDLDKDYNFTVTVPEDKKDDLRAEFQEGYAQNLNRLTAFRNKLEKKYGELKLFGPTGMKTVMHEIQHAIQDIEGFAKGGNSKGQQIDVLDFVYRMRPAQATFARMFSSKNSNAKLLRFGRDKMLSYIERLIPSYNDEGVSARLNELHDHIEGLDNYGYRLFVNESSNIWKKAKELGNTSYNNLSGEVEARNVEKRMGMTEEQRRETPPSETEDVAREEQGLRFSVTAEQDQEYLDAVNSGDMEKAQRMVDEAAKAAGYNIRAFHGTPTEDGRMPFTVFKSGHFTDDFEFADYYGNAAGTGYIYNTYLKIENPLVYDFKGQNSDFAKDDAGNNISTWTIFNKAKESGEYDGVILRNVDEYGTGIEEDGGEYPGSVTDYIPMNPSQIKSADPVTYDDNGNVIQLSERFNPGNEDIRFSVQSESDSLYDQYEKQDGEAYPWMSEEELIERIEEEIPYGEASKPLYAKIDEYRRLDSEDFDEGRRDFSGGEKDEVFQEVLSELQKYEKNDQQSLRFSVANRNQDIFISNADRAVANIRQEKATPEQWLKMIEKNGGLKAGEDKWLGLSEWLKGQDKKTLTKQEIQDFIDENKIRIEETRYAENVEEDDMAALKSYNDEFNDIIRENTEAMNEDGVPVEPFLIASDAFDEMVERYGEDFDTAFTYNDNTDGTFTLEPEMDIYDENPTDAAKYFLDQRRETSEERINQTRLHYTTEGLENNREIALTVPTIESWNESDQIHFGDAGEGRAIAWIRFGDATKESDGLNDAKLAYIKAAKELGDYRDSLIGKYAMQATDTKRYYDLATPEELEKLNSLKEEERRLYNESQNLANNPKKVLVLDEIQSKRHQEAREKGGYKAGPAELKKAKELQHNARKEYYQFVQSLEQKYGVEEKGEGEAVVWHKLSQAGATNEEIDNIHTLYEKWREASREFNRVSSDGIPAAPFEKNWHELAMKRMLRLAAEEGYDYIAWTTGEQQAERYGLSNQVSKIEISRDYRSTEEKPLYEVFTFNSAGNVIDGASGMFNGERLGNVFGKELATRLSKAAEEKEGEQATVEGEDLKVGGEGMKGFYDEILPRFMNKYGKQWGVKVKDIKLPNIGEDALGGIAKGLTMHSVPVTQEMKDSVMEGQLMFSMARNVEEQEDRARMIDEAEKGGLKAVIGEEGVQDIYREAYASIPPAYLKPIVDAGLADGGNIYAQLRAYMHNLAKEGTGNDPTGLLFKLFDDIRFMTSNPALTDADIRWMLFKETSDTKEGDLLALAEERAMKNRWGVGQIPAEQQFKEATEEAVQSAGERMETAKQDLKEQKKTLYGPLEVIAKAMAAQKTYDKATVDNIVRFAKDLIKNGKVSEMSRREVSRLLTLINSSTGKSPKFATRYADQLMDMLLDHIVDDEAEKFEKLIKVKAKKVNQSGVEVQGKLDKVGQAVIESVRDYMHASVDAIKDRLLEISDDLDDKDDTIRANAMAEYQGLMLALQYKENIAINIEQYNNLKREFKQVGNNLMELIGRKCYDDFIDQSKLALRTNLMERINMYRDLSNQITELIKGSVESAAAFRKANQMRIEEIHRDANFDMKGVPAYEHLEETAWQRFLNSDFVRFFTSSLATADQMFRLFGRKSVTGEGYLHTRYVTDGFIAASENAAKGIIEATKILDNKVSEVYGKDMKWSDLYKESRKPGMTVTFLDGGEMREHELSQGNMLYIYMADKMIDGKMKLRKMGISEQDVEAIKKSLSPEFIELADWMQDEFYVNLRNKYNVVHERMFGAPMGAIDDYVPLKILSNARFEDVDLGAQKEGDLSSTITGSIIKRTKNSLALDILHTDAFSLAIEHIEKMEDWAAFAELRRDMNTLLSYKHFRNQVVNMNTVYGSGEKLWRNFKDVCSVLIGKYQPKKGPLDSMALNVAKGVTAAKIAFRVNTAIKQILSFPAYLSDARPDYLIKSMATPGASWKWCMENLPLFEKRWKSRIAGDTRLLDTDSDWKIWRDNVVKTASRLGMTPNAFVDATTVAIGAKAMYDTKKARYIKDGYSEEKADEMAKRDAEILYNQTQQSTENAFVSPIQLDRTVMSVTLSTYRNSSMAYQRQLHDAIRTTAKMMKPGYRQRSIDFMTYQNENNGLSEEEARKAAEREYNRQYYRSLVRVAVFGYGLQFLWKIGNDMWYLLFGDDDDEKQKIIEEAALAELAAPLEGLVAGNVISDAWGSKAKESVEGKSGIKQSNRLDKYGLAQLPLVSDMKSIMNEWSYDKPRAVSDIIDLVVQSGVGVNPQTITDAVVALIDYANGDVFEAKELALAVMRMAQIPQSTIEKFMIDEIEMDDPEQRKEDIDEMAKRYAMYKLLKNAPSAQWMYDDETREKRLKSYEKQFKEKVKNRIALKESAGEEIQQTPEDIYKDLEKEMKAFQTDLNRAKKDGDTVTQQSLESQPEYQKYLIWKKHQKGINKLTNSIKKTEDDTLRQQWEGQLRDSIQTVINELNATE